MKKILITAFDPFGGQQKNASLEVLKHLEIFSKTYQIHTLILPTIFQAVEDIISAKIDILSPDIIILLGEAGLTKEIRIERVAINIDDARIKDNLGNQPIDLPIKDKGENAYFSTLPIKKIKAALDSKNIPSIISNSAGTFVCNHAMYLVLHYLQEKKPSNIVAGFIHFPYVESQIKDETTPHLPLKQSVKALETIIEACL
ncbi:MAG: pyroglutamyl-peptidase I [Acholeplasmataceae bacterium]